MWRTKRREEGEGRLALAPAVERGERGLQAERALERTPAVDVLLQIALSEFCAIYPSFDTSCHLKRSRNATSLALLGHAKQAREGAAGGANARLLRSEGASQASTHSTQLCATPLAAPRCHSFLCQCTYDGDGDRPFEFKRIDPLE